MVTRALPDALRDGGVATAIAGSHRSQRDRDGRRKKPDKRALGFRSNQHLAGTAAGEAVKMARLARLKAEYSASASGQGGGGGRH
jgi:hypothetical protein